MDREQVAPRAMRRAGWTADFSPLFASSALGRPLKSALGGGVC